MKLKLQCVIRSTNVPPAARGRPVFLPPKQQARRNHEGNPKHQGLPFYYGGRAIGRMNSTRFSAKQDPPQHRLQVIRDVQEPQIGGMHAVDRALVEAVAEGIRHAVERNQPIPGILQFCHGLP